MKQLILLPFLLFSLSCSNEDHSQLRSSKYDQQGQDQASPIAHDSEISSMNTSYLQTDKRRFEGIGINFEDKSSEDSDQDFNDVMLCLEGHFEDNDSNIVSVKEQDIQVSISTIADCHHDVTLLVTQSNASIAAEIKFKSRSKAVRTLRLEQGESLKVSMRPDDAAISRQCDSSFSRKMDDKQFAILTKGVCSYARSTKN